uniref:CACTA en-spm transposon protein n=1 Tax=Syphacia muris TaxID=451379 RepID=A0A0N5AQM2_9BILA
MFETKYLVSDHPGYANIQLFISYVVLEKENISNDGHIHLVLVYKLSIGSNTQRAERRLIDRWVDGRQLNEQAMECSEYKMKKAEEVFGCGRGSVASVVCVGVAVTFIIDVCGV